MTGGEVVIVCEWHRVGEVRTAVWCDRCLLPSAVETDVVLVNVSTLAVLRRGSVTVCDRCGTTWRASADPNNPRSEL